jgi:sortase (surface protein transpeptidase)
MAQMPVRKKGRLDRLITISSIALILAGIFALRPFLANTTRPLGNEAYTPPTASENKQMVLGEPVRLLLPAINVDLGVIKGYYNAETRQWTLDNTHAFYMQGSATPLFYGHNRVGVFENLNKLQPGETLLITNSEGRQLRFAYKGYKVVKPEDSWLLQEKNPETVMVMSCTGIFYESRQVLYFAYEGLEK